MKKGDSANGCCQCGALQFSVRFPTKWMAHCHCTMCRRAHGAAFVTWVGVEDASFELADPDGLLRWYASSPGAERGFCSRCGSMLFFRSQRWPGEIHVVRANFDSALEREPQVHVFYDTRVSWFEVNDALPKRPPPAS
ncbi:MAG: hypothetical protein AMXMBFR72_24260 [Betaproteobacteria bacterium]